MAISTVTASVAQLLMGLLAHPSFSLLSLETELESQPERPRLSRSDSNCLSVLLDCQLQEQGSHCGEIQFHLHCKEVESLLTASCHC